MAEHGDANWRLRETIRAKRVLLLDFDGPICSLFSGYPAPSVAEAAREFLGTHGESIVDIDTDDPLALLRSTYLHSPKLGQDVESFIIRHEVRAAASADPTPGASETMRYAGIAGSAVLIVSNNSDHAIRTYLARHAISDEVEHIVARPFARPDRMKPDPYLVNTALELAQASPDDAVFIGDTVTDVVAGNAVGVTCIGYAKSPDRHKGLADAGAAIVIDTMTDLAEAWR